MRVELELNDAVLEPMHEDFGEQQEASEGALTRWLDAAPGSSPTTPRSRPSRQVDRRPGGASHRRDLADEHYVLPAAGLPWFMTLFGRDTLITSLQTVWVGPDLARGALHLLGELQGTRDGRVPRRGAGEDPARDPLRRADRARREASQPVLRHLGCDAAVARLAVGLLAAHRRREFVRDRWQRVLAALEWIDRYGDRDGDGYIEYATRSSQGLGNQCWKDSWDGIQFHDGRIPFLPIAAAEIQGYVYDAKLRIAELAERAMGDTRSPTGSPARPRSCSTGSTATSGPRSAAATTSSGSTVTSSRSTRSPRTWGTCCGRASCRTSVPARSRAS